jgi:2-polyprenyl-6-methoxyphenol hydroxylase-like FAD-dependent oxidoreductase
MSTSLPLISLKVAIIGGSIGGLAAANSFHRLGAHVKVFEKADGPFSGRGGSIGFCQVPLWEAVRGGEAMMRRGQRANRSQGGWIYGE